jgi:hypothetical protein
MDPSCVAVGLLFAGRRECNSLAYLNFRDSNPGMAIGSSCDVSESQEGTCGDRCHHRGCCIRRGYQCLVIRPERIITVDPCPTCGPALVGDGCNHCKICSRSSP